MGKRYVKAATYLHGHNFYVVAAAVSSPSGYAVHAVSSPCPSRPFTRQLTKSGIFGYLCMVCSLFMLFMQLARLTLDDP